MNKTQIFEILDKDVEQAKILAKIFIVVGILMTVGGGCWYFFSANNEGGWVTGGLGLVITIACSVLVLGKVNEKKVQFVKETLETNPKELVWSYVDEHTTKGVKYINVMMCFRNGKVVQVSNNSIPSKDTKTFMLALKSINPEMHLGYSEEIEYKFKKKTL